MKKHIPLLILTLFLISVSSGAVIQDSVKHTLISDSDTPYEGIITEGTKEKGKGIFVVTIDDTLRKGSRYEGEFLGTQFHGQGMLTYANGTQYIGEWKDNLPNGQGTTTTTLDGRKYVGEWKDNQYHGQGTFTLPDGGSYVGEWKDGLANGQGTNTFPDGSKYVGEHKDGMSHIGVYYPVKGEPQSGIFADDGTIQTPWTIEAVSDYLKNKYPQFTGLPATPAPTTDWAKILANVFLGAFIILLYRIWDNYKKKRDRDLGKPLDP